MLQIKEICKEYRTGSLVQKALDKVSLNHKRDFDEEIQRPGLGFVSESHDRFCVSKL